MPAHIFVSRRPLKRVGHAEHEHRQQHHWEHGWEHYANHSCDNPVFPSTFHLKALHMAIDDWLCDYCKLTEYTMSTASLQIATAWGPLDPARTALAPNRAAEHDQYSLVSYYELDIKVARGARS